MLPQTTRCRKSSVVNIAYRGFAQIPAKTPAKIAVELEPVSYTHLDVYKRQVLEVNSIVATIGHTGNPGNTRHDYVPPLNNQTLFRRDAYICMYCGMRFAARELSRDHIRPFSQKGTDIWTNVVAACRRCNNQKASRTPEQAKMQLIAVPFTPTYAEYIFLKGRRVLADQMEYLLAHFPRSSPLHARIQHWLS